MSESGGYVSADSNFRLRMPTHRINGEGKPYVEYGVQCMFRAAGLSKNENIVKWKFWRRYNEFKDLDT